MRSSIASALWPPLACALLLAACSPAAAQPVPKPETRVLPYDAALRDYRAGDRAAALSRVDAALKDSPRDVQLRFLRGVLLSELNRLDEAAEVFATLTREFPELPEPHNNLAVIHASQGRLDKARDALEHAVRAVPDYALAHENLGDLYLQFAAHSYQQALRLDGGSRSAQRKLALAREIVERIRNPADASPSAGGAAAPASAPASR